MITLKIQHYTKSNNLYFVALGNGANFEFTTEKKCKKFLCDTSRFLTDKFNQLNLLFGDAFLLYRQNYFYLDNDRHQPHQNLYTTRREINADINAIETLFESLSFNSYKSNANQITFIQLCQVCQHICALVLLIKKINQKKSFAAIDIRAEFILNQVLTVKSEIQNYNITKAISFFHNQQLELQPELRHELRIVG